VIEGSARDRLARLSRTVPALSALEVGFPAASLSNVGLAESWRKEVHRPATSTHKWWAKRLGTVFRGIITSAVSETTEEALNAYQSRTSLSGLVILDPFGGSGTTCVEAVKLGASAISFDINPVATLVQRQAIQAWNTESLIRAFSVVELACRTEIDRVHLTENGRTVLYYFWVATAFCPECAESVRLFSNTVFSRNAYPKRIPKAQIVCPRCLDIQEGRYDFESTECANGHTITQHGSVRGSNMTCANGHATKVLSALGGRRPAFEMYAKLVVDARGRKSYESITGWDRRLYRECEVLLDALPQDAVLPAGRLAPGNNTDQALRWNFREWRDFFNARQLYSLSLLATAVRDVDAPPAEREALCALFSGSLEFNNLFASFKGEGTGAVRHMFAHHVLKPERTPLEAHPWGTPQSSGSFSTLLKSRLLRAQEYKRTPTDLVDGRNGVERVTGISKPLDGTIAKTWDEFAADMQHRVYIATRDAAHTDLPAESVDLVITDPPYMDNVYYAELADFFHAWLRGMRPYDGYPEADTTRMAGEVQHADPAEFGRAIEAVWRECARVLKPTGLMAFTFHQARMSGWIELVQSLANAGLAITAIQPVKGEMARSVVKAGSREPSNLDSVVVCRKGASTGGTQRTVDAAYTQAVALLARLIGGGVAVGPGDVRSVVRGTVLAQLASESADLIARAVMVDCLADKAIEQLLGPAK
jgi:putative DNA methylase